MVQHRRRFPWRQAKLDRNRMTLRSPNAQPVVGQRKPLLVAGFDDMQQIAAAEPGAGGVALLDQVVDANPTLRIEREADAVGLVTQDEAQELAELDGIERHHRWRNQPAHGPDTSVP